MKSPVEVAVVWARGVPLLRLSRIQKVEKTGNLKKINMVRCVYSKLYN